MSKAIFVCITLVLVLSLLCYFTATSFNLRVYLENLDKVPTKPTLPDWSKVTYAFDNITTIGQAMTALKSFFVFIGDCLAYPIQYIVYLTKTVYVLSNGMLEKDSQS